MKSRKTKFYCIGTLACTVLARAIAGFLWAFAAAIPHAMAQNQCMKPGTNAPCLPGGLTSAVNIEPSLNLGAGNPVHLATGHKIQIENDGPFRRHYHANLQGPGTILGPAWSMDWETRLSLSARRATIQHADASRTHFMRRNNNSNYTSPHGTLARTGKSWTWQGRSGQVLEFNLNGRLTRLHNAQVELFVLRHLKKKHPLNGLAHTLVLNGREIKLQYRLVQGHALLETIHLPSGPVRYAYTFSANRFGSRPIPRLRRANWPDGTAHRYHYAVSPPSHSGGLIGIDKQPAPHAPFQPWRHWTLDQNGRVKLFALHLLRPEKGGKFGTGGTQYLAFQYESVAAPGNDGITHVKQANGKHTRFFFQWVNGQARLHAVSGDPCPGCAAPGTRAQYTRYGELKQINGLRILRKPQGQIQQINLPHSGWPDLQLHFNHNGKRQRWYSLLTGNTVLSRTPNGLPSRRAFANGDIWQYQYDGAARPVKIISSAPGKQAVTTTLQWRGKHLTGVYHPNETLQFEYDSQGRLVLQRSTRPMAGTALTLQSRFTYNKQNQRIRHDLPEGGSLLYTWHGTRLQRLVWESAQGQHYVVVQAPPLPEVAAGYRYGNGLQATTTIGPGFAHQTLHTFAANRRRLLVWQQTYRLNSQGLVVKENIRGRETHHWRYKHDQKQRLMAAQRIIGSSTNKLHYKQTQWYAWQDNGALLAHKTPNNSTQYPKIQRDPSGQPTQINRTRLQYGANRRLKAVLGARTIHYQHNAFGQLIKRNASGLNKTPAQAFWYLDGQRVAELTLITDKPRTKSVKTQSAGPASAPQQRAPQQRAPQHRAPFQPAMQQPVLSRRYLYVLHTPVGLIQYSNRYPQGRLYFIQSDLLGAPRLVTDLNQKVMWLAHYSPTGQANIEIERLPLNLRLPGQHADPDTGWHDNLHRTYDPRAGHYLEPDPLGPFPGGDALGYAMQQPRRYIDPLGLMLFAFDGTRNNAQTQSNVWKLAQRYESGPVFYQAGPGNPYETDWDALTAYTAPDIINRQWQNLLSGLGNAKLSPNDMQPIDILGYSRGSAMARHFANQVSQYTSNNLFSFHDPIRGLISACVDLRFLGLFDTVAQFGIGGSRNNEFNMTIDDSWQWVAHAIALHERRWLFPLMVVGQNDAFNSVEAPFIGAHADIGGGIVIDENGQSLSRGDLSDVSLNWMLWQARAASLQFSDSLNDSTISSPVLHDARNSTLRSIQNGDRSIENADGTKRNTYQDQDPRLGRVTREQVESFIQRLPDWRRQTGNEVGQIDMHGYASWLYDALGWQALDTTTGNDSRYH